jgi:uncharacterized Tic20 family protein
MSEHIDKNILIDHALPQPDEISERDREDAMGAYLMMFAAVAVSLPLPIINLVAAIIYYYVNRTKSRYIHFHCHQSLISQIPTTLLNWGLLFYAIKIWLLKDWQFDEYFVTYMGLVITTNIVYTVFSLIAAINARKGKMYYFIFFGKSSYNAVFNRSVELEYDR